MKKLIIPILLLLTEVSFAANKLPEIHYAYENKDLRLEELNKKLIGNVYNDVWVDAYTCRRYSLETGELLFTNHVIGSGSGTLTISSWSGWSIGDVGLITPGTYSGGMSFTGTGMPNGVIMTNNGGLVKVTATIDLGNSVSSMTGITFIGNGDPAHLYGIQGDGSGTWGTGPPGYYTGSMFRFTATHCANMYFYYIYSNDLHPSGGTGNGAMWDFNVNTPTYAGTTATLKLQYGAFNYCKSYNDAFTFICGNYALPASLDGLLDSVEIAYDSLTQCNSPGSYVSGNIFRLHAHHNWILWTGYNTQTGDQGAFNTGGNAIFDHNYMHGGRGYLSRLFGCSITAMTGVYESWAYDNIILATTTYAAFDWRSQASPYYSGNAYLGHCNLHIVCNTIGNKIDDLGYVTGIATVDDLNDGATIEIRGNLPFNLQNGSGSQLISDYSHGTWLTEATDTSKNWYYTSTTINNQLSDTILCTVKTGAAIIAQYNASSTVRTMVTTTYTGLARPSSGTNFTIGANEPASTPAACNCIVGTLGYKKRFVSL